MQQDISRLRQILSGQIIPSIASNEKLGMILAQRPLHLPPGIKVRRRPAPSLSCNEKNHSALYLGQDQKEEMHAIRFPYLCYVVEGEIDMRLGIPATHRAARGVVNRYEILTLPEQSALLIPPGVFFPAGIRPHWERPSVPVDSHMFWVHILPTGIFCHTSGTRNGVHTSENLDVFVPGQQFSLLVEMLFEELQLADSEAAQVARNALLLLFTRIMRGLREGTRATLTWSPDNREENAAHRNENSLIVQRACQFIRKHNANAFRIEDVAAHAYVSPSHLMRLFRTELNCTIMEYTLKQRFTMAETWLINSDISINQIAHFLSYKQTPQFIRAFKRVYGITPTEFRHQHGKETN